MINNESKLKTEDGVEISTEMVLNYRDEPEYKKINIDIPEIKKTNERTADAIGEISINFESGAKIVIGNGYASLQKEDGSNEFYVEYA